MFADPLADKKNQIKPFINPPIPPCYELVRSISVSNIPPRQHIYFNCVEGLTGPGFEI